MVCTDRPFCQGTAVNYLLAPDGAGHIMVQVAENPLTEQRMKEKNVAGILALFLGGLGIHRFYLGQTGLGIFYLIFFWFPVMWIVGLIDAISFFSMDIETFDRKYNREFYFRERRQQEYQRSREDFRREQQRMRYERRYQTRRQRPAPAKPPRQRQKPAPKSRPTRPNPHKAKGVAKFKEYDYDGAIEDFKKALEIEPEDIATHFNIACAYSINEEPEKAFHHLDRAVANGFTDFQRIKKHDKLAFLRIQDEFEEFKANGFRLKDSSAEATETDTEASSEAASDDLPEEDHSQLLEQLKKLGELREKGLLTEEEFSLQKKKLLG